MSDRSSGASRGFGIGSIIATVLSYMKWHSIGWAIVHCLLGWIYVIYYMLTYWGK